MKSLVAVLICALCPIALAAATQPEPATAASEEPASAPEANALPPGMQIYYMVLLRRCPELPEEPEEGWQEVQAQHMANIRAMADEGILRLAGPFGPQEGSDLAGIFLLEMDSLEAAERRAALDPAAKAGRLCPQVLPWLGPVDITHGYEAATAADAGS